MTAMKEYMPMVAAILAARPVATALDTPSGSGWLRAMIDPKIVLDGIDLYDARPAGFATSALPISTTACPTICRLMMRS